MSKVKITTIKIGDDSCEVDLTSTMDVFLITNGRKSFDYTLKALENQKGVKFNLGVIKNAKWIDACNGCLSHSTLPRYLRLDDDMILHPRAVQFFDHFINAKLQDDAVIYCLKLWEPWNNRLANKVKVYVRKFTRELGFETDSRGKVDKIFIKKSRAKKYKIIGDKTSSVGIHAACSFDDNYRYSELRGELEDPTFKIRYQEILKLDKVLKNIPYDKQLKMANKDLAQFNMSNNTWFSKFLNEC